MQPTRLSMYAVGVAGDAPSDAVRHRLVDGIHLRWVFEKSLGFPQHGFHLFRRRSLLPGERQCLRPGIDNVPAAPLGAPFMDTPTGRIASDSDLVLTDEATGMLLADLAHVLHLSGPLLDASGSPTARGDLRDWAFLQIAWRRTRGMRGIAQTLTTRPAKTTAVAADPLHAGAPFELPYTLAISDDEHGSWRLQLALLDASDGLVAALRSSGETGDLLDALARIDAASRAVVQARLAAA